MIHDHVHHSRIPRNDRRRSPRLRTVLAGTTGLILCLTACQPPLPGSGAHGPGSGTTKTTSASATTDPDTPTTTGSPTETTEPSDPTGTTEPTSSTTPEPTTEPPTTTPVPTTEPSDPPSDGSFPNADNTGYKHTGVTLTRVACNANGEYQVDKDGTVLDSLLIPCAVRVRANNVTISRSLVVAGDNWAIYKPDDFKNVTITDVEIDGTPGLCLAGIGFSDFHAKRVDIHDCGDGVRIEDGSTIEDSWIHDFWDGVTNGKRLDSPHNDGAQITGGSNITIRHNRIDNPKSQTSCILVGGEFGSPSNILIENNYLNGGNFTIYLDPKGTNRVIRNNTFTRNFVYGPDTVAGQLTWTGNHYTDGTVVES